MIEIETRSARSLQPGLLVQIVPTSGVRSVSGQSVRKLSGSVNLLITNSWLWPGQHSNIYYLGPQNERLLEFLVNFELATTSRYLEPRWEQPRSSFSPSTQQSNLWIIKRAVKASKSVLCSSNYLICAAESSIVQLLVPSHVILVRSKAGRHL